MRAVRNAFTAAAGIAVLAFPTACLARSRFPAHARGDRCRCLPISTATPVLAGITLGPDGALWFCDFGNNIVVRMTASGLIRTRGIPRRVARAR